MNQDINLDWRLKKLNDWYVIQIAARIFNDMVSLERKKSNETSSPFPPPYAKLQVENNYVVCGLGEEVGHD